MPNARARFVVTSLMSILAAGCLGGTTRFYTLSSNASAPLAPHHLRIGLGPVGVPAYLEPPALATRVDANRSSGLCSLCQLDRAVHREKPSKRNSRHHNASTETR